MVTNFDRALEKGGPGIVFVHPGTVYNVFSVCVRVFEPLSAPCGVRVRRPFVISGTQNCTLSCSVCVFAVWRACKAPLSCSVVHQNCTLSCSVCVFAVWFAVWRACKAPSRVQWYSKTTASRVQCVFLLPAAYTTPSYRETKTYSRLHAPKKLGWSNSPSSAPMRGSELTPQLVRVCQTPDPLSSSERVTLLTPLS